MGMFEGWGFEDMQWGRRWFGEAKILLFDELGCLVESGMLGCH